MTFIPYISTRCVHGILDQHIVSINIYYTVCVLLSHWLPLVTVGSHVAAHSGDGENDNRASGYLAAANEEIDAVLGTDIHNVPEVFITKPEYDNDYSVIQSVSHLISQSFNQSII